MVRSITKPLGLYLLILLLPAFPLHALSNYEDLQWITANPGPHAMEALVARYGQSVRLWRVEEYTEQVDPGGGGSVSYALVSTRDPAEAGRAEFSCPQSAGGFRAYTVIAMKQDDGWHIGIRQTVAYMP